MAAIIEKNLTEVAAVAYLRGIDNEGNSVKVATNNVTANQINATSVSSSVHGDGWLSCGWHDNEWA